jgi:hypothetical protein
MDSNLLSALINLVNRPLYQNILSGRSLSNVVFALFSASFNTFSKYDSGSCHYISIVEIFLVLLHAKEAITYEAIFGIFMQTKSGNYLGTCSFDLEFSFAHS